MSTGRPRPDVVALLLILLSVAAGAIRQLRPDSTAGDITQGLMLGVALGFLALAAVVRL